MNKNLAITILTWNDWENTIECLESIYQSDYNHFDIILIDNNSDKFHLEKIYDWSKNKIKVEDKEFNFNPSKRIDIIKVDENFKIQELGKKKIYLKQINLLTSKEELNQNLFVKVRSTGNLLEAKVDLIDKDNAKVNLVFPEDGISPGQACVFYRKDQFGHKVLGGGWIKE